MGVSGESTFPPGSGRWDSPLFAPQAGQALPGPGGGGGSARSAARKTGEELPKLAGGVPRPGETKRCVSPGVRSPSSLAGEGERAALPRQSYPTSEQLLLSPSLAVGLPRYQHHPSPVCDRKDFVLNFNGISSFHPSASGSYYHHHHHQSVCQDIKPCVM